MSDRLKSEHILAAMTYIEDEYIQCALDRLGYLTEGLSKDLTKGKAPAKTGKHTQRETSKKTGTFVFTLMKRAAIFIGVVILAAAASVTTAMAFNEEFKETVKEIIFEFFHVEEEEVVPELSDTEKITIDTMYVEQNRSIIGGVIEGRYVHTPVSCNAREGVYLICTDEIELNQGSHYDAYYEENGEFIKLEEHTFRGDYTVLGNEFHVEFDWAVHDGQVVLTYVGVDENYRIPANPGDKDALLVELLCTFPTEESDNIGTSYPVLLNLETGELKDVLAGTGAEKLMNLCNQAISEDGSKMLLAQSAGSLYYVDLATKTLYSVEELSGEPADACSLIGDTLTCWVLENDKYRAWVINLTTMERVELFSEVQNIMGESYTSVGESTTGEDGAEERKAGIVYLSGFDTIVHWGTMFSGSHFALETDEAGNVSVIDLTTGEKIPVEGFTWPADRYTDVLWESSSDGKRLLISAGEIGSKYECIGVLDFEKMKYLEFSRKNSNEVYEWKPYWFDKDAVIIQATDKDSYYIQDYYVYDIQDSDTTLSESDTGTSALLQALPEKETIQEPAQQEPKEDVFVRVTDYIPDAVIELRYGSEENFTGRQIYAFTEAWLRYGTVKKLMAVQEVLRTEGLYLKIWDAFRPPAAQYALWEAYPDATYVSDPNTGFSSHSKGNTVDVTLVDAEGHEVIMPTDFDDFTALANRDYSDCSKGAAENALLLEQVMIECGFKPYQGEWWHYSDVQSYDVEKNFIPKE